MASYTKRIQTVLTEDQFEELARLAETTGRPISVLVREAIEAVYFRETARQKRQEALEGLLAMNAPVAGWDQMEAEIIRGAGE